MKSFKKVGAESIRRAVKLLVLSSMSHEEKMLWFKLIPELNSAEIERLNTILSKEVEQTSELYLDILAKKIGV